MAVLFCQLGRLRHLLISTGFEPHPDAEAAAVSIEHQRYDPTPFINPLRRQVDRWRAIPDPSRVLGGSSWWRLIMGKWTPICVISIGQIWDK